MQAHEALLDLCLTHLASEAAWRRAACADEGSYDDSGDGSAERSLFLWHLEHPRRKISMAPLLIAQERLETGSLKRIAQLAHQGFGSSRTPGQ